MILSKLSIAYFLLRVTISRVHRWIIYFSAIITVASCATFFFVSLFQCYPVYHFWTKHMDPDGGTCIDMQVVIGLAYLFSAMSIMSDFTFALLPAWIVSHLNMRTRTKAALITLMGLGCLYVCCIPTFFSSANCSTEPAPPLLFASPICTTLPARTFSTTPPILPFGPPSSNAWPSRPVASPHCNPWPSLLATGWDSLRVRAFPSATAPTK